MENTACAWIVVPPFTAIDYPSLHSGLIKQALSEAGFDSKIVYLNRILCDLIGENVYRSIAGQQRSVGVGDWVGSATLRKGKVFPSCNVFRRKYKDFYTYLEREHQFSSDGLLVVEQVESITENFVIGISNTLKWKEADFIFFCCSHQQLGISLAICEQLKRDGIPGHLTLFGTTVNARAIAEELINAFPFLDSVIYTDPGAVISTFGHDFIWQQNEAGVVNRAVIECSKFVHTPPPLAALNLKPSYGDFYSNLLQDPLETVIPWRTSVGCKWGDHRHCSFCGLIQEGTKYHRKPHSDAVFELVELINEHEALDVISSDLLLDEDSIDPLLTMVSALDVDVSLFFEVRASLKKGDIALLLKGGVGNVQVGIESLDTNTLKCMHKGTTFLVNVRFLKWCLELGICASWIYLYGFQGESKESLNDQAKKIKNLTHLQPPIAFTPVRVERGSPMHKNPESYGFCQIWPAEAILHSLPLSLDSLSKITVYFEHEYKDGRDLLKDGEILGLEVFSWKRDWKTEVLYYRKGPQFVKICDLRDTESVTTLKGWHYDVFLMLDNIKSFNSIIKCVNELHKHVEVNDIEKFLHDMEELGFLISDKNLWLSVVPRYRQDLEGMRMMRSRVRGG